MIRHQFKPIASIELHGARLSIHHESNATDIACDAGYTVNGIQQQVFTDALAPMENRGSQTVQPKCRHFERQSLAVLSGQIRADEFGQVQRLRAWA